MHKRISMLRAFGLAALVVCAAVACTKERPAGLTDSILTEGKPLYSQNKEELIIRHFFQDKKGGFFLDVGASDPVHNSTTYYLEKHLGWKGIAIDALPWLASPWAEKRPNSRFFNYIVTDHSGTIETFYAAGPISSVKKEHIDLFQRGNNMRRPQEIKVPTITLNELLDRERVSKIDFLSMDIEEAEPQALAGFDIRRFRPELVCIEAAKPVRDSIATYFADNDYVRIDEYLAYDNINWYYRPR